MKRNKEVDDLKCYAIQETFDSLTLKQKRRLIPQLLKSAKMMHKININHIEPKFKLWLCSGKKQVFKNEEVYRLWKIWNLIKNVAYGSRFVHTENQRAFYIHIYDEEYDGLYDWDLTNFFTGEEDSEGESLVLEKKEFFDWVLKNTTPDEIHVDFPYSQPLYRFPDFNCLFEDCNCGMSKRGLEKYHGIDFEEKMII